MAEKLETIAKKISGKNMDIIVSASVLSDQESIEKACKMAIEKVGEAIKADVTYARRDIFADKAGRWSFPAGGYDDADSYYSSGLIPYWRGGLLGSFDLVGSEDSFSLNLAFTAEYASTIEEGGFPSSQPPAEWFEDKGVPKKEIERVAAHPFMSGTVYAISVNLQNFGYLDLFSSVFAAYFK